MPLHTWRAVASQTAPDAIDARLARRDLFAAVSPPFLSTSFALLRRLDCGRRCYGAVANSRRCSSESSASAAHQQPGVIVILIRAGWRIRQVDNPTLPFLRNSPLGIAVPD